MEQYIKSVKENRVGTITFYSDLHNAMSNEMLQNLVRTIEELSVDDELKVIVLKSEGEKVFCAGASFKEFQAIKNQAEAEHFFRGFAQVIQAIRRSTKIVVCRVQGKAVGGGVGLAAAADYAIATKDAGIRLSELMNGIGPFVIGPAVERKMGVATFQKMCLTPDQIRSAEWATHHNLYQECFESVALMDEYIDGFVVKLIRYPAASLRAVKQMYWEGTTHWEGLLAERVKSVSKLLLTEETQAIIQAL